MYERAERRRKTIGGKSGRKVPPHRYFGQVLKR
jgi:hypothetical protein